MPVGTRAPAFSLPATDGTRYSLDSFRDSKGLVVIFTCNHCPYAIAIEDRLVALANALVGTSVNFVAINSNDAQTYPDDSFDNMVKRAGDKHFPFPYLHDESQSIARAYDAACTPDIFVFNAARELQYNGRFDDNWKEPDKVTRQDLREVIESVLHDQPVPFTPVHSMGCSIKWKK
jgi:peroxiredoxin